MTTDHPLQGLKIAILITDGPGPDAPPSAEQWMWKAPLPALIAGNRTEMDRTLSVTAAARGDGLRLAVSWYNDEADIAACLTALADYDRSGRRA